MSDLNPKDDILPKQGENTPKKTKNSRLMPPWKPGQSGNPAGRPPGALGFKTIFDKAVRKIVTEQKLNISDPQVEMVTRAIIESLKGNLGYYKDVMDRLHGQAVRPVDITSGGESFIRPTPEEQAKAIEALKQLHD